MSSQFVMSSNKHMGNIYHAINFLLQKDHQETAQKQRKRIGFK